MRSGAGEVVLLAVSTVGAVSNALNGNISQVEYFCVPSVTQEKHRGESLSIYFEYRREFFGLRSLDEKDNNCKSWRTELEIVEPASHLNVLSAYSIDGTLYLYHSSSRARKKLREEKRMANFFILSENFRRC